MPIIPIITSGLFAIAIYTYIIFFTKKISTINKNKNV
jgi:hypothetical protein